MLTLNKRFTYLLAGAATLLAIPLIAMQFTKEVDWSAADFMVGGILLFGTAFCIEMAMRFASTRLWRIVLCAAILIVVFLIWAELAVGIFGTPFAGS